MFADSRPTRMRTRAGIVAIVLATLAGCGPVTPSPTQPASSAGGPLPPLGGLPAEPAVPVADVEPGDVGDIGGLGTHAWWRRGWRFGDGVPDDRLIVGRLDGTGLAAIDLGESPRNDGFSIVSGPAANRVAFVIERNGTYGLQVIDIITREMHRYAELDVNITDVVISPDGSHVYWLSLGEMGRGGVWRVDLGTGQAQHILAPAPPAASRTGIVLAAVPEPMGQLGMSADGRRLAVLECDMGLCGLRVVDLVAEDTRRFAFEGSGQEMLGFAETGVALRGRCLDWQGDGELRDDDCAGLDALAQRTEIEQTFQASVELPDEWSLTIEQVPGAPPLSFAVMFVASPDDGGDKIRLRAMGESSGQG